MDLYSRNGKGRPASSDHFIRTNASVRGVELTIVSLLDANIGSLILHFHLITIAFDVIYPQRSDLHV